MFIKMAVYSIWVLVDLCHTLNDLGAVLYYAILYGADMQQLLLINSFFFFLY